MKTKVVLLSLVVSLSLCGCAGRLHVIGYDIIKPPVASPNLGKVAILTFKDERPQEERVGTKGKLLRFSSKDANFNKKIPQAITEILSKELSNAGFLVVAKEDISDYKISGSVKHFQAIMSAAKITFLPYLGSVSTLWAKDDFTIALSIYIRMADQAGNILIDKTFDVAQDLKLPTGLLNLARYSRGFNYKLKLLDEALKDVIGQICDETVSKVKNKYIRTSEYQ